MDDLCNTYLKLLITIIKYGLRKKMTGDKPLPEETRRFYVRILDVRDERSVVGSGRTAIVVLHIGLAQRSQSQSPIIYCNPNRVSSFPVFDKRLKDSGSHQGNVHVQQSQNVPSGVYL